ncbi:leucine carboxyl methyltransferase 1-like [Branchiostoma floridae x Branchiostoma japonicum]
MAAAGVDDSAVIATNDDAASCKRFAVQQGYWKDPYIQHLVRPGERKAPEINRGYYARTQGVGLLLDQFLRLTKCQCQVVSLGAGFETTYWRLKDEGLLPRGYFEVDFPAVTSRKCHYIRSRPPLSKPLTEGGDQLQIEGGTLHCSNYHILSGDLRNTEELNASLTTAGIDKSLPTLFVTECVLVYLTPDQSSKLVRWAADNFPTAMFVNYEQVNMKDKFGQVMVENLKTRHCHLAGVDLCADAESQKQRFLSVGWEGGDLLDMWTVYHSLPQQDVQRIERLEFLDEVELLQQLLQHYCITWAWKDPAGLGLSNLGFGRPSPLM